MGIFEECDEIGNRTGISTDCIMSYLWCSKEDTDLIGRLQQINSTEELAILLRTASSQERHILGIAVANRLKQLICSPS
jgi:hypothetical protein